MDVNQKNDNKLYFILLERIFYIKMIVKYFLPNIYLRLFINFLSYKKQIFMQKVNVYFM